VAPVSPYGRQQARHSLLHTVGFRGLSQICTVLSYIVLVRGMSEHSFGVLNLLYAVIPVVSTVASLGLEQTLRRYQPEYLSSGNTVAAAWLTRVVGVTRLTANVTLLVLILLAWNLVAPTFQLLPYRSEFAIFGILILLHFQTRILQFSLASHMFHRYSVGSAAVLAVVKLILYVPLYSFHALTLTNAIFADIAAYGAMYAFLYVVHRRHCRADQPSVAHKPDQSERRRLWRYSLFNNFNDAGSLLTYVQIDNFFIAAFLNPVAVGAYSFYTRLNQMTVGLIPIRAFENVVQPLFFAIPAQQARERIPRYFTLLLNSSLAMQLPMIAFALVYHRELVDVVFSGKFSEDSQLLPLIVALATASNVISIPVTLVAQHAERASLILVSQLFGLYQIAAMVLLVPLIGIYGAALATGTFHLLRNLFVWWQVRGNARWLNLPAVLTYGVVIWGGVIAAGYLLKAVLHIPSVLHMIIGAALCGFGVLAYLRSPAFCQSDREILGGVLHGREGRLLHWLGIVSTAEGAARAGR
jgi:O-antigen/teichoic acid export membrane protein